MRCKEASRRTVLGLGPEPWELLVTFCLSVEDLRSDLLWLTFSLPFTLEHLVFLSPHRRGHVRVQSVLLTSGMRKENIDFLVPR